MVVPFQKHLTPSNFSDIYQPVGFYERGSQFRASIKPFDPVHVADYDDFCEVGGEELPHAETLISSFFADADTLTSSPFLELLNLFFAGPLEAF